MNLAFIDQVWHALYSLRKKNMTFIAVSLNLFLHVMLRLENYTSKKTELPRLHCTQNFKIFFYSTERIPSKINLFRSKYTFYKTLIKF